MNIESNLYSLRQITEQEEQWHFRVPLYQRLYVWGDDQVRTLLEDLCNAHARGEPLFFLGGTLMVEQESSNGRCFDLVDGQQRFTTLWLLCRVWRHALDAFMRVKLGDGMVPRLQFAIRPEVNRFLADLAGGAHGGMDEADAAATARMRTAMDLMESVFQQAARERRVEDRERYRAELAEYVFTRVRFVITTVPRQTDLNKLFEVINNRGAQLQHHEVLKARLLQALEESERSSYALLWDACAGMDDFIEDNLCALSSLPKHRVTALYEAKQLLDAACVRSVLDDRDGDRGAHHARSLHEILGCPADGPAGDTESQQGTTAPSGVRSMFGFPLFLQHVLRIWLAEQAPQRQLEDVPRLLDRDLLALFDNSFFPHVRDAGDARSFIDLLWRLRVLFDQHFIKWVDQGEEEVHLISAISVSTSARSHNRYMNRSRESDTSRELSLLQSMLYHSQEITTQYWVTPLLMYVHRNSDRRPEQIFQYVRHLDNHLLGSATEEPLVRRTRSFMADPWQCRDLVHASELKKPAGTEFAHYWFYKLEFVLWYLLRHEEPGWSDFRMTAKSSVEHVSPQTPTQWDDNRVDEALHHFGNLALVSRSVNSEYGNLPYNEKRQRFHNRNKARVDSLKLDLIYRNRQWSDELAFAHQAEMIRCMDRYCDETPRMTT